MTKLKRLLALFMAMLMLVGCSATTDYEAQILSSAESVLNDWGYIPNRTYSVNFDGSIYTVDINGSQHQISSPKNTTSAPLEITGPKQELTADIERILNSSKDLVCSYVEASKILENKSGIIEYISNIPAYLVEMEDVALYQFDTIYINSTNTEVVCEWMIVHELVHALADFTNGSIENERYPFNLFNEVITDIITSSMNPSIAKGTYSGYAVYHDIGYAFIGCFAEDALYSYFYGYDTLLLELGAELDFFVFSLENMEYNEVAFVCVNNSINHWQENR